jgi:hypothetical protein
MCRIYGGASPLTKAQLQQLTGSQLYNILGKCQITLVSCHDFAWQEGKEAFIQSALFARILTAVRVASACYALENPWPEEYAAKERAASSALAARTKKARAPTPAASEEPAADDEAGPSTPAAAAGAGAGPSSGGTAAAGAAFEGPPAAADAAGGAAVAPPRQLRARGVSAAKTTALDPMRYGEDSAAEPTRKKRKASQPPLAAASSPAAIKAQLKRVKQQLAKVRDIWTQYKPNLLSLHAAPHTPPPSLDGFITNMDDALKDA